MVGGYSDRVSLPSFGKRSGRKRHISGRTRGQRQGEITDLRQERGQRGGGSTAPRHKHSELRDDFFGSALGPDGGAPGAACGALG
eukprot:4834126-Pyramimonas_sp.AAC.1